MRSCPLDNHLGWQGWQIDLPADWNPGLFRGNARSGTVIVGDLERPRLELNWRRVRSARRVDLSRLTRADKSGKTTWKPFACRGGGIADARRAVADNGDTLTMMLADASRRLLFAKIVGTPEATAEPLADSVLASLGDATDRPAVPWRVYGFAWTVPPRLQLARHRLEAGRTSLTFRHRRRSLILQRWIAADGDPDDATLGPPDDKTHRTASVQHNGHHIQPVRASDRKLWDRLLGGQSWSAQWRCRPSNRHYRVQATGPESAAAVAEAVRGVQCHDQTDGRPPQ